MMKEELEKRLGFEITETGFQELNKMYMSCSLDKDDFSKLVKSGAKVFKVERKKPVIYIRYAKYLNDKTPNGCWYIGVKIGEYLDCDIRTGKIKVKFLRYAQIGDSDSYYGPDYSMDQIIEIK